MIFCKILSVLIVVSLKNVVSEENNAFIVTSTKRSSLPYQDDEIVFQDQTETRAIFAYRLDKLEFKINQMQHTLEKLIRLHENERLLIKNHTEEINKLLEDKLKTVTRAIEEKQKEENQLIVKESDETKKEIIDTFIAEVRSVNRSLELFGATLNCSKSIEELLPEKNLDLERLTSMSTENQLPRNCQEVKEKENNSGIYIATIQPKPTSKPFDVLCNMDLKGGGWTYFMRRFDGSEDFYLNWTDYKQGFGKLSREFWLGLEHLYEMTNSTPNELVFEFTDWEGKTAYSHFDNFSIGNESDHYQIRTIDGYHGDAGSSFKKHWHYKFETIDNIQERYKSCVTNYHAPWWYGSGCFWVKLTGKYLNDTMISYADGIHSYDFHGYRYSLKKASMLIRPPKTT